MKLLIIGPPGVGKGTQAKRIREYLNIAHLSTGSILRAEIRAFSAVGKEAKKFIDKGKFVPDKYLTKIVRDEISSAKCKNGYLLDGYPRTITQANKFEIILNDVNHKLDAVIGLRVHEDELIRRLINRGRDHNRSDDLPEIIRKRQNIYWERTAPLLDYYSSKGLLKSIDGLGDIDEITKKIINELK